MVTRVREIDWKWNAETDHLSRIICHLSVDDVGARSLYSVILNNKHTIVLKRIVFEVRRSYLMFYIADNHIPIYSIIIM